MMRPFSLIIISFCLFLVHCRKNTDQVELTVEGRILKSSTLNYISGAEVVLSEQVLEGGIVSGTYNTVGQVTTGSNGFYTFTFDRKNALEYLIEVDHPDYFPNEKMINPDDLSPDNPFSTNVTMDPRAWLQVRLFNQNPEDSNDQITYQNLNANFPCVCCTNETIIKMGTNVDTTFTCQLVGDRLIYYNWVVNRFSSDSSRTDSIFCPAFDTTYVNIFY